MNTLKNITILALMILAVGIGCDAQNLGTDDASYSTTHKALEVAPVDEVAIDIAQSPDLKPVEDPSIKHAMMPMLIHHPITSPLIQAYQEQGCPLDGGSVAFFETKTPEGDFILATISCQNGEEPSQLHVVLSTGLTADITDVTTVIDPELFRTLPERIENPVATR